MYEVICEQTPMHEDGSLAPLLVPEFIRLDADSEAFESEEKKREWIEDSFEDFLADAREALVDVGLIDEQAAPGGGAGDVRYALSKGATGGGKTPSVERLLNRLLGVKVEMQERIFDYFEVLLEAEVAAQKKAGNHSGTLRRGLRAHAAAPPAAAPPPCASAR